jgi:hypothetical protein
MFTITAKQHGNSIEFVVDAQDIKGALAAAKHEANRIFEWKIGDPGESEPKVSVKIAKE